MKRYRRTIAAPFVQKRGMAVERYRYCGGKPLRCGYTTGTCAAAAAKAAALRLLGLPHETVKVVTPAGVELQLYAQDVEPDACGVRKDAGDDPDVTDGLLICARVERARAFKIEGGAGVGRVTLPGLEQPVGAAAINSGPRRMIARAVREALGPDACVRVTVFIPGGGELAKKTCNPRLGIQGGLSILGTTGIVEPMSESALTESIRLELSAKRASGARYVLMTPGNYGESFARAQYGLSGGVLCSNFLGNAVDDARALGFSGLLLIAHAGKLVKAAGGIFTTHSRTADARMEILAAHAALAGADRETVRAVMACVTTDAAFDILEAAGVLAEVTRTLLEKVAFHLQRRAGEMETAAVMFTNTRGELGRTADAGRLLEILRHPASC